MNAKLIFFAALISVGLTTLFSLNPTSRGILDSYALRTVAADYGDLHGNF